MLRRQACTKHGCYLHEASGETPGCFLCVQIHSLILRAPLPLQVSEADVLKAIRSFPSGSSGGPDGLRPQHVVDLVGCQESGADLLRSAITAFTNMLLDGKCHRDVVPVFLGGTLIALEKKSGWRHQTDRHWLHLETHCL